MKLKNIASGQVWHLILLALLLLLLANITGKDPEYFEGSLWNIGSKSWFLLAVLVPIAHQMYVLICWRLELYGKRLTHWFGDRAFSLYKKLFTLLILGRPVTLIILALANKQTLELDPVLAWITGGILFVPAAYLFYSVKNYFGFDRAFGIDHFEPEKYQNAPLVKKGIFKYTDNGMYTFGFLILYLPTLIWLSKAALVVAIFQHLYIWVHHFFTEKPDMNYIYGRPN
jgi:protein-S-isoprenylcysteine O-methyltransferase Ste14